jgi:hypothetical protein
MAYLNTCTELDDLGKGSFRSVVHLKPVAYLENGVYRLSSANVAAYADGTYSHAVLAANIGARIGDDGRYAVHPTRELARYVAFGGPQVKVGGKWTAVPFDKPTRKDNTVIWTQKQADLKLTHIGHGLKHEMWLKNGYVPEDNLVAVAVNLVGLTRSGSTLLADGKPVARIQSPVVYDAANRLDTRPIKWGITSRDGQPYIVYTLPDLTGMAAPVVDPTLTLQPDDAVGEDTYANAAYPNTNEGTNATLIADTRTGQATALLKFDLSSIPAGATLDSATLQLWIGSGANEGENATWTLRRILAASDWTEAGATWNKRDGVNAWAGSAGCQTSGTDFSATTMATATFTGSVWDASETFTFTDMAELGLMQANNYGMRLYATSTTPLQQPLMRSSAYAVAGERPKLVVEYTLPSTGGGMLLLGVG